MSNFIALKLNFTNGSSAVSVADGTPLVNILPGDMVFVAGYLPLRINASTSQSLTLANGAPLGGNGIDAVIVAGTVPVRDLFNELKAFSEGYADWFARMETWLNEIGSVDVLGPSGTVTVSTLPQILLDASNASQQAQAALTLIGNAPQYAATAEAARDSALQHKNAAEQAVTDAQTEVGNAAAQVTLATNEKNATAQLKTDVQGLKSDVQGLLNQTQTAEQNAAQSALDAAAQVTLAEAEKNAAAGHTATALDHSNTAQNAAAQAVQAVQSATGGLFFAGDWDASGGNPPPAPSDGSAFYKITVAGVIGGVDYGVGDNIVYNNITGTWFKLDNTESVTSVNGKQGVVTLDAEDISTGVFAIDRIPNLPASKITSGVFALDRIPSLTIGNVSALQGALDALDKKLYYTTGDVTVTGPERVHHVKRWGTGTGTISIDTSALTHPAAEVIIDNVREDSGTATVNNLDGNIYLPDGTSAASHTAEGMGSVVLERYDGSNNLMMRAP